MVFLFLQVSLAFLQTALFLFFFRYRCFSTPNVLFSSLLRHKTPPTKATIPAKGREGDEGNGSETEIVQTLLSCVALTHRMNSLESTQDSRHINPQLFPAALCGFFLFMEKRGEKENLVNKCNNVETNLTRVLRIGRL